MGQSGKTSHVINGNEYPILYREEQNLSNHKNK